MKCFTFLLVIIQLCFSIPTLGQTIVNQKIIRSPSLAVGVSLQNECKGVYANYTYPLVYTSKMRWFLTLDVERMEKNEILATDGVVLFEKYKLTFNNASLGIAVYNKPINEYIRSFANVRFTYTYPETTSEADPFKDVYVFGAAAGGGFELRVSEKLFFQNSIELGYREWIGETIPEVYQPDHLTGQLKFGIRYYLKRRIANFRG